MHCPFHKHQVSRGVHLRVTPTGASNLACGRGRFCPLRTAHCESAQPVVRALLHAGAQRQVRCCSSPGETARVPHGRGTRRPDHPMQMRAPKFRQSDWSKKHCSDWEKWSCSDWSGKMQMRIPHSPDWMGKRQSYWSNAVTGTLRGQARSRSTAERGSHLRLPDTQGHGHDGCSSS